MANSKDMAAQLAALQVTVADLQEQCDAVHKKLGWPSWENEKRQREDNARAQGTKLPSTHNSHFGR
jgi:hypothetical protein